MPHVVVFSSKGGISAITVIDAATKEALTGVTGSGGGEWISDEPPKPYLAGSWGPTAAIALIARDGRAWFEEAH